MGKFGRSRKLVDKWVNGQLIKLSRMERDL